MSSKEYKKLKRRQSRQIRSQTNDPALNKDGILNVPEFLKSRKYEIHELEKAQLNSQHAASTRTFQSLPRSLRRRTASHNVKRIPKRLRKRALREMASDSGTSRRKRKPKGRELFRLKMLRNLLRLGAKAQLNKNLPQDQRLAMGKLKIRQRIKLLNEEINNADGGDNFIKLNNTIGSYDNVAVNELATAPRGKLKYMKRQRDFVWLSTHVWHAKRAHMIKRYGYQIPLSPTQKCFRASHRNFNLSGGICWDRSYINTCVLQSDNEQSLFNLISQLTKIENPKVMQNGNILHKLCYQNDELLGEVTILIFNNDNIKKVVLRLHPSIYKHIFSHLLAIKTEDVEIIDNRFSLASIDITGPNALSSLATILKPIDHTSPESRIFGKLACEASIPDKTIFTLTVQDPRIANRTKPRPSSNINPFDILIEMKSSQSNINMNIVNNLLTSQGRSNSYENQMSLKQIAQEQNKPYSQRRNKNSGFPIIIYQLQNVWTVLIPWYWTLPIWYQLNHLSHLKFGGLRQIHQRNFERNELFYPKDFPFVEQGYQENQLNSSLKKQIWLKKPPSKRLNYYNLKISKHLNDYQKGELGDPFGCDWRYLQILKISLQFISNSSSIIEKTSIWNEKFQRQINQLHDVYNFIDDVRTGQFIQISDLPIIYNHSIQYPKSVDTPLSVIPISLESKTRGNFVDNARIYSIPENVKLIDATLKVPHSKYLIGFITSGSFNLSKGKNTGIGCIDSVWASKRNPHVLVRNVGTDYVRLATWTEIKI